MSRKKAFEFYSLVKSMRSYQKQYFAAEKGTQEKQNYLLQAKQLEYKVDDIIQKTEDAINGMGIFNQHIMEKGWNSNRIKTQSGRPAAGSDL